MSQALPGLMSHHARFGTDPRRDAARERLAPLLSDARTGKQRPRRLALRARLPRRSRARSLRFTIVR
jgi:hypothetical protein